ncbi:MAG: acyl-CoA/acyl-ACP dehydrogenase [Firmicutes bacterium]|nr:acyl-CoA/acyl-ACP dehydrogenase [Bacillota bacterium]
MLYFDLDMNLSEENLALKTAANKFAAEVMRPVAKELDQMSPEDVVAPESPFWDFLRKAYKLGYHKLTFPEEVGGQGLNPLQLSIVMEELAWGSFGLTLQLNTSFHAAAALGSTEEHIMNFTIPYCNCTDASIIGCWAISEPDHGSDGMPYTPGFRDPNIKGQCTARLDGDEYVIKGQKAAWVSSGTIANYILLMCQIEPSNGFPGFAGSGVFIFSLDRPGVSRGKPWNKLGARELNQGEIYFDDVRIPKDALLVGPEGYEGALISHLCLTTPMVGTWSVGLARAAFEEALDFARKRVQGGKPLVDNPNVQQKLFDMFRKVEASRQLCRSVYLYNYNWSNPPEKRLFEYGIAAKTFATQAALEVTSDAIQLMGGCGLSKEYQVEKFFRDARATLICDGSNDTIAVMGGHIVGHTYPRAQVGSCS